MSSKAGIKGLKTQEGQDAGTFDSFSGLRSGALSVEEKELMAYRKILRHFLFRGLQFVSSRRPGCV